MSIQTQLLLLKIKKINKKISKYNNEKLIYTLNSKNLKKNT